MSFSLCILYFLEQDQIVLQPHSEIMYGRESTVPNQPAELPTTLPDIDVCKKRLQDVETTFKLRQSMDPDNGLLYYLHERGFINTYEYNQLENIKPFQKLNEKLLVNYIKQASDANIRLFLEALNVNHQKHIAAFIANPQSMGNDDRLLNSEEIEALNTYIFDTVKLIDPFMTDFLNRLVACKCITEEHKDKVKATAPKDTTEELICILKRRPYIDFYNFRINLREILRTKIGDIQKDNNGAIGIVNVKLHKRSDREDIEAILIDILTGFLDEKAEVVKNLTEEQVKIIKCILTGLKKTGVRIFKIHNWHSIAIFLKSENDDSVTAFEEFHESGKFKEILEQLFSCLLNSGKVNCRFIFIHHHHHDRRRRHDPHRHHYVSPSLSSSSSCRLRHCNLVIPSCISYFQKIYYWIFRMKSWK